MVAISFHSLEDRIVKDAFRAGKIGGNLAGIDAQASDRDGSGDRKQSPIAQRQIAGG